MENTKTQNNTPNPNDTANKRFQVWTIRELVAEGKTEEDSSIDFKYLKKVRKGGMYHIEIEGAGRAYLHH